MWSPVPQNQRHSSAQWSPAYPGSGPLTSSGNIYGGPLDSGSSEQDMVWDESRGGYWVKETIMSEGELQSSTQGWGGYGSSFPGAHNSGAGCKGCTGQHVVKPSLATGHCRCAAPQMMTVPAAPANTSVILLPCNSCKCSSKSSSQTTAFPLAQDWMYRSSTSTCGSNRCAGGSSISCGCHASPSCGRCGAYH